MTGVRFRIAVVDGTAAVASLSHWMRGINEPVRKSVMGGTFCVSAVGGIKTAVGGAAAVAPL